ncbi:MAG: transporter, partial [Rhodobacteraceae bacterium]|nr:transporter [Paracoccaceae bacterium]
MFHLWPSLRRAFSLSDKARKLPPCGGWIRGGAMQPAPVRKSGLAVPAVFTLSIFISASLLFFVQPMFAKMVLPSLGGSPAVWTTAMLFFQTVLLLGYVYVHLSVRYLNPRAQVILHLAIWAAALVFLPITVPSDWHYEPGRPAAVQALGLFAVGVGLPFAALSATAPLLQAWYARTSTRWADDPYFLYSASNLGSLLSLLAFPFVAEPLLGVHAIGVGWAAFYFLLGPGLLACGFSMGPGKTMPLPAMAKTKDHALSIRQIVGWLFMAFIPSSLMLSVTSTVSTDIGSFPLIWIIPLALYLLTFVFTFSGKSWPDHPLIEKLFLIFLIYTLYIYAGGLTGRLGWLPFGVLICFFFLAAL